MSVTATGYISRSADAVAQILAASSEVQGLLGVQNAADALAKIVYHFQRGLIVPPTIHVMLPPGNLPQIALDGCGFEQDVGVWLCWPVQTVTGDSSRDVVLRAMNRLGQILLDIRSKLGTDPLYPARANLKHEGPYLTNDNDTELKGCWEASITFTITWR
jgi:hypothetical protein